MTALNDLPTLTSEKMRQLHSLMEAHGFSFAQQLQRAGATVALMAAQLLADDDANEAQESLTSVADRSIVLLTGGGDTGTIGLHAARILAEQDAWVQVLTLAPSDAHHGLAADALNLMLEADVPLAWADEGWELPPCDLLIDAMNGLDHGLLAESEPRHIVNASQVDTLIPLIELANSSLAPILSVGIPSSAALDNRNADAHARAIFVKATATLSFGLLHEALLDATVRTAAGDLYLADVGIPSKLLEQLNISALDLPNRFAKTPLIRL